MGTRHGLTWVQVSTVLLSHPKTVALVHRLNDRRAAFYVIAVWIHVGLHYPDGFIPDVEEKVRAMEAAAEWTGDRGQLRQHLVDVGFLEERKGRLAVHGWREWSGAYQEKLDRDRARQRANRAKALGMRRATSRDVHATSPDVAGKKEKENEKKNNSPLPPGLAKEGDTVWAELCCALKSRLRPDLWERWFKELHGSRRDASTLEIAAPDTFTRDLVEEQYRTFMTEQLAARGHQMQLVFTVTALARRASA